MPRPVPPQIIPRPPTWRPGDAAPWGHLDDQARRSLTVEKVLAAMARQEQLGPVPADIGADRVLGPTILINETNMPALRHVNSAVLAALFEEAGEARLIFTRRSTALRSHRGEVSFPGGRLDPGEGPSDAAVREAFEEIALQPGLVTPVGWIHPVLTMVSGSLIMPVLATLEARPHVVASPAEVERVFDVSLRELAEPSIFHEERWSIPGREIPGSPDNSFAVWFFEVMGEMIWGATARMIHELLSVVLLPAG
jgi:8-oxo-dGTP pyrophosphatase MutT (NUDIX family)